MEPTERSQRSTRPKSSKSKRKARGQEGDSVPTAETGKAEATATTSGNVSVGGRHTSPQSAQRVSSPPSAMGSIAGPPSSGTSGNPSFEVDDPVSLLDDALHGKTVDLVLFMLLKYIRKQMTTKAEILNVVIREHEAYYSVIFTNAVDYLRLIFGLEIIERNTNVHSYSLVHSLGITYDGMQHGFRGIPKTGLLIVVLCIIFIQDSCVSEEVLWRILNRMELYAGRNHFIYGDPKTLINEHFVQEGYLEYRQNLGSDPPTYEFLWGPRAHAETSKMKIIEFVARVMKKDPRSFSFYYNEALRDQMERR